MSIDSIVVYTDGSAIPNPGLSGYGFYGIDNRGHIFNGYGPVDIRGSNNAAELTAAIRAISYFNSLKVKSIEIISDSKYVIDGIRSINTWRKNKWLTSTGTPVANMPLWVSLDVAIEKQKAIGTIKFTWVKGHNGNVGNEAADKNANIGRLALGKGDTTNFCEETIPSIPKVIIEDKKEVAIKPKKTPPVEKLHPLISGKQWFFNTNQTELFPDGRWFYTVTNYKNIKDKKNKDVAKLSADTGYSVVILNEPILTLNSLRSKFNNAFGNLTIPVIAELATITKASIWPTLVETDNSGTVIKGNLGVHSDSSVLAEVLTPPRQVYKLESIFIQGITKIDAYENKTGNDIFIDITTQLLTSNSKGKQAIADIYKTDTKVLLIDNISVDVGRNLSVKLIPNVDVIPRNNLSALVKHIKEPVIVTLVLFDVNITDRLVSSYRVCTIISNSEFTAIYFSPDSNYRIVTQMDTTK